jgi:branched-chain amino acid transport system substrate-binding protein
MKKFTFLAASFLALLFAAGTAWAETVKVGIILPYSGPNAQLGQQVDRGFELYQKLHADGTGGHKIEIIKRDSTGPKPDVAKRLATELITRDKVDIVAGVVYSNNAFAISDVTRKAKVPLLIMNAGTAAITTRSPYTARVSFTMWQAAYPLGKYAYDKMKIRTAAVAYANYSPGKDSKNAFTKAFTAAGGKVVADIPFPFPKIPDFTPFLQSVKDAKPDALYVFIPAGKWATGVMKTYDDLGMRAAGIELIGPGDITQDSELPNMGQVPLGVVTMHHYSADYDTPVNQAFVAAWKKTYGEDTTPDFMGVGGWDGMAAIAHAIREQDGNITAEGTMKALAGWTYESPRGTIMIDPETRDIVHDQHVHEVVKGDGRLMIRVLDSIPQVRDPCKELMIGKCK